MYLIILFALSLCISRISGGVYLENYEAKINEGLEINKPDASNQILLLRNDTDRPEFRIVGGSEIDIKDAPYQVQILFEEDGDYNFKCGGVILSAKAVLTAAHCFLSSRYFGDYLVLSGSRYMEQGSRHKLRSIAVHEEFNLWNIQNDIALLTIHDEFEFSCVTKPIAIAESEPIENETAIVTGFGTLKIWLPPSPILRKVELPISDRQSCNETIQQQTIIVIVDESKICTSVYEDREQGFCKGDSGGPLVVNGRLAGLTSFAVDCGRPSNPNVFTNVWYFSDWIKDKMKGFE